MRFLKKRKRLTAAILSLVLGVSPILAGLPATLPAFGAQPGDIIEAHGEGFHHYCIDGYGANRAMIDGDKYQYILPMESLTREETAVLFWSMLTLQAAFGTVEDINRIVNTVNTNAPAAGLPALTPSVTEEDLKKIIHIPSVRNKYGWLDTVLAHEEEYLQLAGLMGASSTVSGKSIPTVLQGHHSLETALSLSGSTKTIAFDPSGADAAFIREVPLAFSSDGSTWSASPPAGWSCEKTDTAITLTSASTEPMPLFVRFETSKTGYGAAAGSYTSVEEVYESCLQLWVCVECAGTHVTTYPGEAPLEKHQRLIFIEAQQALTDYYASTGGGAAVAGDGGITFRVYRHEEDMKSTCNVQLYKYDHETGRPLENAVFNLYERFDDRDRVDREKDGSVHLYEGGEPYASEYLDNPVVWDGFRFLTSMNTDKNGHIKKEIAHRYHYDKTFCDGHPAPTFVAVPEEEIDEETGEVENEAEIEAAQAENMRLADLWLSCVTDCEEKASGDFEGVHFHWIMDEVDTGEISSVAGYGGSPGEHPSAGRTTSVSGPESYEKSGCQADCEDTYEKFISMRYSYGWKEETAREGYILHDLHRDDVPIEVITTDASEHGANAEFAGLYSTDLDQGTNRVSGYELRIRGRMLEVDENGNLAEADFVNGSFAGGGSGDGSGDEGAKGGVPKLLKQAATCLQKILSFFLPEEDAAGGTESGTLASGSDADKASGGVSDGVTDGANLAVTASASDARRAAASAAGADDSYEEDVDEDNWDEDEEQDAQEIQLENDLATPANAGVKRGRAVFSRSYTDDMDGGANSGSADSDASAGEDSGRAAFSDAEETDSVTGYRSSSGGGLFAPAYQAGLVSAGTGEKIDPGPDDNYSHCNDADHEGDAWRVYDHRTEGEIHINKRDLQLEAGESASGGAYDSYGDTQGDAILEGAVYGLFAAEDLIHPDGKTGVVYEQNDLVAVASTDKEGDASFLVCTQAPGYRYDYEQGKIAPTGDGWSGQAPGNLYISDRTIDDYTADRSSWRTYYDNAGKNGNGWIGRPLLLGDYYVKELTRSEGYELSVTGQSGSVTNFGQNLSAATPQESGYAVISVNLYPEQQIGSAPDGSYQNPDVNELFFEVTSQGRGEKGFDVKAGNLPEGIRAYRLEQGTKTISVTEGTGIYEQIYLTEADGSPQYIRAAADGQYPKYGPDGSVLTEERAENVTVSNLRAAACKPLDAEIVQTAMEAEEDGFSAENVAELLQQDFSGSPADYAFIKRKVERALRACRKRTPAVEEAGAGETDEEAASMPLTEVLLPVETAEMEKVTTADVILSLLDYYNTNSWLSFGGVESMELKGEGISFRLYTGLIGNPENYVVTETEYSADPVIFHRVETGSRYTYAAYSGEPLEETFGTYEDYEEYEIGSLTFASAVLVTDAVADEEGTLSSKMKPYTVYYQAGELVCDEAGNPIQETAYQEITSTRLQQVPAWTWIELPVSRLGETPYVHLPGSYTDSYGKHWSDEAEALSQRLRFVLPEKTHVLTREDLAQGNLTGWSVGDVMGSGAYYLDVKGAYVKIYPDITDQTLSGADSYVKTVSLVYPGQTCTYQDGEDRPGSAANTRSAPVGVNQRVIRQQVQVVKRTGDLDQKEVLQQNFRFKIYLRSNLKRLFRDEDGTVIWQNRKGEEIAVLEENKIYPELVSKLYTKVLHETDPLYRDTADAAVVNDRLYDQENGYIREEANEGYTCVLERTEDGLNYEKFFHAMAVANHDKWDDAAPSYTSWRPFGNEANRTEKTLENAKASDQVRQFAIDWYLDEEVKKLLKDGLVEVKFTDELYDEALNRAIRKADNYLKPFFAFDLDEIYAVLWDSEQGGGRDGDESTLSADQVAEDSCVGTSVYLPYGVYVVAEQQPQYPELSDLANKHYQIDKPREVIVPSVYEDASEAAAGQEVFSERYCYDPALSVEEMEKNYHIRFREEAKVIYAHGESGDFEVYPYGLALSHITNGVPAAPGAGQYAALTQSQYRPEKNYYNETDRRSTLKNEYYLTEGQSGRDEISAIYRYSSVSEQAGRSGGKQTMQGMLTAIEGEYAPMLVPYTMAELQPGASQEQNSYQGNACAPMTNVRYRIRLRLEKLDSETHENLLHDEALFNIYEAKREKEGEGNVCFYEKDTVITGTREFLEAMGASGIQPLARERSFLARLFGLEGDARIRYSGMVPAGTPICEEGDRVFQQDSQGQKTGVFKSFSTVRDGEMVSQSTESPSWQEQTVGYLETPQPLASGVYVIAEQKAPAGYSRSKPMAVEVYSDKVTYYKEGNRDDRVLATIYERDTAATADADRMVEETGQIGETRQTGETGQTGEIGEGENGIGETGEPVKTARVYVENEPIRLQVEKQKESDPQFTWKVSGRIEGTLAEIGNNPDYVYAYRDGVYLGYAWKKGTLEYLKSRKDAGEEVEIVYEGGIFSGYGYVTGKSEAAAEANRYVPGALMTLFDAIELERSGDSQDHAFSGLKIERSSAGNILRMYVESGYAGERTEFVEGEDGWQAQGVPREDTDILYYDLDSLRMPSASVCALADKRAVLTAKKGEVPYLEFEGGDFTKLSYNSTDKVIMTDPETKVYHLDRYGNRDALVDPYTGMAYVVQTDEAGKEHVLVWPIHLRYDDEGNIIARDKITTSRIAQRGEAEEDYSFLNGSFLSGDEELEQREESHQESSLYQNAQGQDLNDQVLVDDQNGDFDQTEKPVYDEYGLLEYYTKSEETYDKSTDLYDRDGEFVRAQDSDNLAAYDRAAYEIRGGQEPVAHRNGEAYILENTWTTSDQTPNDPFHQQILEGQPDILKRVPAGCYIMEELQAPEGYRTAFPTAVRVAEQAGIQNVSTVDETTKTSVEKLDGPESHLVKIRDMNPESNVGGGWKYDGTVQEGLGAYTYGRVTGAVLALYRAEPMSTTDLETYPDGYALQKIGEPLLRFETTEQALWLEKLPVGYYVLEEEVTPPGFVSLKPMEFEVTTGQQVGNVIVYNDHTKVEIEKYFRDGEEKRLLQGAEFTLYALGENDNGADNGQSSQGQMAQQRVLDRWISVGREKYEQFPVAFEEMYRDYGTQPGTSLSWESDTGRRTACYVSAEQIDASEDGGREGIHPTKATMLFRTDEDELIRITVYGEEETLAGRDFTFEYQYEYHRLPEINGYACSYLTREGRRRLDYLPAGTRCLLEETKTPSGFVKAENLIFTVEKTVEVQLYHVENQEGTLWISKQSSVYEQELTGAVLELYRAAEDGSLIRDKAHLQSQWTTGNDGVYTELDEINNRIPEGYHRGDRKPHQIRRLPSGTYWLVEQSAPGYYTGFEPVRIDYQQEEEIRIIRVLDEPVKAELTIQKTDQAGGGLAGAVWELTAYEAEASADASERTPVLRQLISAETAVVIVKDLPVGAVQPDGSIAPYRYYLKEVMPPEGYAAADQIYTWEFSPDKQGVSYTYGELAHKEINVTDDKIHVQIGKRDQREIGGNDIGSGWIEGAKLELYEIAEHSGDSDIPAPDSSEDLTDTGTRLFSWTTTNDPGTWYQDMEGLTAGHRYLIQETEVPAGYGRMEPLYFSLTESGSAIAEISRGDTTVSFHYEEAKTEVNLSGEQSSSVGSLIGSSSGNVLSGMAVKVRGIEAVVADDHGAELAVVSAAESPEHNVEDGTEGEGGTEEDATGERVAEIWIESTDHCFRPGNRYVVTERSGDIRDSFAFYLDEHGYVRCLEAADRQTEVSVSKQEITGEKELPGCSMEVKDSEGRVVDQWVSEETPHKIIGILHAGETYTLTEISPAGGYTRAEEIIFTVREDGRPQQVIMKDAPTNVCIRKVDKTTGKALSGAVLRLLDPEGKTVDLWTSREEPHVLTGELKAGAVYRLEEVQAPSGYRIAEPIEFTVPEQEETIEVVCENERRPGSSGGSGHPTSEAPKRIGTVTAVYSLETPAGNGWIYLDTDGYLHIRLPGTGDERSVYVPMLFLLSLISLLGVWLLPKRRKK